MNFSFDSWPWKIALVVGLLAAREFVRLLSPKDTPQNDGENGRWLIETIDSATIAIGLVLFVIQPFILQAFYIPSGSMENTLKIGDRLLVSKIVYRLRQPQHGDVIVFHAPRAASPQLQDDDFIKRCIGTEGDRITMNGRTLTLNGKVQQEPYTYWDAENNYGYDMRIVGGIVYSREYRTPRNPGPWTYTVDINTPTGSQLSEAQINPSGAPATAKRVIVAEPLQTNLETVKSDPIPAGKVLMMGDHRNNSSDGHVWGLLDKTRIVGKAVCVFWPGTRLGLIDRMSQPKAGDAAGSVGADSETSGSDTIGSDSTGSEAGLTDAPTLPDSTPAFPTPAPNPLPPLPRITLPARRGLATSHSAPASHGVASHSAPSEPASMTNSQSASQPQMMPVRMMSQGARMAAALAPFELNS